MRVFVMRLLARVTGENSEAIYVAQVPLAGAVPEKKRKDRNTKISRIVLGN